MTVMKKPVDHRIGWIQQIVDGSLTTFTVILAMELIGSVVIMIWHLGCAEMLHSLPFHENEGVQLLWSILRADLEEKSVGVLLQMVVNQWVKIRGF